MLPRLFRPLVATLALAAAAPAACGGDGSSGSGGRTTARTHEAAGPSPGRTVTTPPAAPDRRHAEEQRIERTVTLLVQSNEQGDAATLCRLVGRRSGGGGIAALERCARSSGVDVDGLPTSDELSIERVDLAGRRATVRLSGGTTIALRKRNGSWTVRGLARPRS